MNPGIILPSPNETGRLKIKQLKRYWHASLLNRNDTANTLLQSEWQINKILLGTLKLGLEQTIVHLYQNNLSFDAFEDWK